MASCGASRLKFKPPLLGALLSGPGARRTRSDSRRRRGAVTAGVSALAILAWQAASAQDIEQLNQTIQNILNLQVSTGVVDPTFGILAEIDNSTVGQANATGQANANDTATAGNITQSNQSDQSNKVVSTIAIDGDGTGDSAGIFATIDNQDIDQTNAAGQANANGGDGTAAGAAFEGDIGQSNQSDQSNKVVSTIAIDGDGTGDSAGIFATIDNQDIDQTNAAGQANANGGDGTAAGAAFEGDIGQSNQSDQSNKVVSTIAIDGDGTGDSAGLFATIDNQDIDQTNAAGQANANGGDGTAAGAAFEGDIGQSNQSDQSNKVVSTIAIDGDGTGDSAGIFATIDNQDIDQTNAAGQANANGGDGTAAGAAFEGGIGQSNQSDQSNKVVSTIAIDGDGTGDSAGIFATIDNQDIDQTNAAGQANANGGAGDFAGLANGNIAQSNESGQANTIVSTIAIDGDGTGDSAGLFATIDNQDIDQTNAAGQANANGGDGTPAGLANGNIAQSNESGQANTIVSTIAIDGDGTGDSAGLFATIDNQDIDQTNAAGQANANGGAGDFAGPANGNIAQSNESGQANTIVSTIAIDGDGTGDSAGLFATIDNQDIDQTNAAGQANANGGDGTAAGAAFEGGIGQSNQSDQSNKVVSTIAIDGDGTGDSAGIFATIDNQDIDQTNAAGQANANGGDGTSAGGASGGIGQSNQSDQSNTIASTIAIDNGGKASGGDIGMFALINNQDIDQVNAADQDNENSGDASGDITQSNQLDQSNKVISKIAIDNSGKAWGGNIGIFAQINNEDIDQVNAADQDNENGGDASGDITQSNQLDQSNKVISKIAIDNSGKAWGGNIGIFAQINNEEINQVNAAGQANLNTGNADGDVSQSNQSDQSDMVVSKIRIDNSGEAWGGDIGIYAWISGDDHGGKIVIDNSGLAVSTSGGDAIRIEGGDDNTLNLMAPAYIGGTFNFLSSTAVNITTGPSHSVLWTFPMDGIEGDHPTISGPVPYFYDPATKRFATYDPSSLAGAVNALGDMTSLLSSLVQHRVGNYRLADANGVSFYAEPTSEGEGSNRIDQAFGTTQNLSFGSGGTQQALFTGPWLSATGGIMDHDGNSGTLDQTVAQWAVAAGYDWQIGADDRFGVMGGYVDGNLDVDSRFADSYDNDASGWFLGVYGRAMTGQVFLDYALTGGWLEHSDRRFVNDNLAPLGASWAKADYDSWWISPEVAIGIEHAIGGNGWTGIPSLGLRYAAQWIDGYTESGSAANATVGARDIGLGEARIEYAARRTMARGHVTGRVGGLYRTSFGDDGVEIAIIGQTATVPFFHDDSFAGYAGIDGVYDLGARARLGFNATGYLGDNFSGVQGTVALGAEF
jgi:hypothetical protein